ncbi:MAG TPA: ISNCY family transposase [Gemmatimonadales bacterium]|nr:ISNCY family transposase [Gemmatimonadales bacterium]
MSPPNEVIPMRQHELHRYHTLHLVLEHRLTGAEAAQHLGLSLRHVRRLLARVRHAGRRGIIHGNRGRPSSRRLAEGTREQVLTLARKKYAGLNTTHLTELLQQAEGLPVSRVTVHRVLRAAGVARPRHRRPPRHRARRDRKAQAGLLVLWDGSPHAWLEARGPRCCLVGALDDATGHLLPGAAFVPAEDTGSYLRLLRTVVGTCGIPVALYMDRHGIFQRHDAAWTLAEELRGRRDPTQVGRALAALGIEAIFALSPQAKGRIERLWGTLQDRLVAELRLAGITTVAAATAFLPAFTTRFNARFGRPPADSVPAWRPVPRGLDLERLCGLYTEATVLNDNTVRTQGLVLQIPPGPGGRGYAKARVEVRQLLDGSWRIYHHDRLLATQMVLAGPPTNSLRRRHYDAPSRRRGDIFTEQSG